jgi:hypothetical protein
MIQHLSMARELPARARRAPIAAIVAGLATAGVLAGALALWAHYGVAVFLEMIVSGLEACF